MLIPHVRYSIVCDTCYTVYKNKLGEELFVSTDEAESDGWQTVDEYHYCPSHTHWQCSECAHVYVGSKTRARARGWHYLNIEAPDQAECPQCYAKQGGNPQ